MAGIAGDRRDRAESPKWLFTIERHKDQKGAVRVARSKIRARDSHFGVRIDKKHSRTAEGAWRKYKMIWFEEVSADSRAIMKGAIHEEAFSTNFPGGNT